MLTTFNEITNRVEPLSLTEIPYESIEFAVSELREMARRFRFLSNCLPDNVGAAAKNQLLRCARMTDQRADRLLYESCKHEFEMITQPGSVHGPAEHFKVCKNCGSEDQGDE